MIEPKRPNPDDLLAHVRVEEHARKRGRLKIFLGYAAGVGKTFAMLEAGLQRKAEGVDVVVGYVDTHGRVETEALARLHEVVPRREVEYRGITLTELDLDRVIARRPQLALVDEFAHTNAPGSRHFRRYQDVEELLEAGIDVYTTLNVQHLESLNDVVAQITGVQVRETIPDRMIDQATEIELIDLPPDELLHRLEDGKVYIPEQARRAVQKFFRKGNLTALRELAMRRAAERVDDQMLAYMQTRAITGPWPAGEHLLVCIGPNPLAERLVRTARRLADRLNSAWTAIYVEIPAHSGLSEQERDGIARALRLAEELGARTITLSGNSIVETIIAYAQKQNVTKVIVGKSLQSRWKEIFRHSLIDQLIHSSGDIDVYIVSNATAKPAAPVVRPNRSNVGWRRNLEAVILVAIATGLGALVQASLEPTNLVMIYLLTVVIAAVRLGRNPAILASILGVLAFDWFFVPPFYTFVVADTQYILTFIGLLVVGIVISQLTSRESEAAEVAQRRERDMATLYGLSRDLTGANTLEAIVKTIVANINQTFARDAAIFLPESEGSEQLVVLPAEASFVPGQHDSAVAVWVFKHGRPAGRGTDTLPDAEARYQPLTTARGIVGVLGIKPERPQVRLTPDERRLLDAFAGQAALAIEQALLFEQAQKARILQGTEKLQTALLNSISHDLRTPLVSITGALSTLDEDGDRLADEARQNLIETAREEAERLNRLVGNLLDMTRLEAGALRLNRDLADVQDVVGAALSQLDDQLEERPVEVMVPDHLPLVSIDFVLIVHVLVNLLDNAMKYSPPGAPLCVQAQQVDNFVEVVVADRGIGIPEEDLEHIFDKFYRVQRPDHVSGTGLGLSICQGIVEAHQGRIHAERREGGGSRFVFTLPIHAQADTQRDTHHG